MQYELETAAFSGYPFNDFCAFLRYNISKCSRNLDYVTLRRNQDLWMVDCSAGNSSDINFISKTFEKGR